MLYGHAAPPCGRTWHVFIVSRVAIKVKLLSRIFSTCPCFTCWMQRRTSRLYPFRNLVPRYKIGCLGGIIFCDNSPRSSRINLECASPEPTAATGNPSRVMRRIEHLHAPSAEGFEASTLPTRNHYSERQSAARPPKVQSYRAAHGNAC